MSTISCHVLDTAAGRPVAGMEVVLDRAGGGGWQRLGSGVTDADGRVHELAPDGLSAGVHRLVFATSAASPFYPEVAVTFVVAAAGEHYHIPLLLSPYGYTTYRGS
jgi:5-hydroxyisourate hydrolase